LQLPTNPSKASPEIAERLAFITEELNDVVKRIRGDEPSTPFELSPESLDVDRPELGSTVDLRFFRLFRFFAVKNITRGTLAGVCYRSGKDLGQTYPVRTTRELEELVRSFNLGQLKIADLGEKSVSLELHRCATCYGLPNIGLRVCHFESGFLAGALETVLQRRINLKETKCCCNGDDHCEFVLLPTKPAQEPRELAPVDPDEAFSQENVQLLTTLATHSIAALENAALFERTKQLVSIDGLTQVFNHRFFQERLREEIERAKRHGFNISLIIMDVDNFKEYNDVHGHPQGDFLLKRIAELLVDNLREIDVVARYGGDEFVVIMPHTDPEGAFIAADRLRTRLVNERLEGADEDHVSVSLGYATFPDDADSAEGLIELADRALLKVKRKGKGDIFRITK
jgi:diguanylate cyclase (GGDEF)-like protein